MEALTISLLNDQAAWPNPQIREVLWQWVADHGGDPKKAFISGYPVVSDGGPSIKKVRIRMKQQEKLMAKLKNGFADLGNNHHAAIFRMTNGSVETEIVSLFEAANRLRRREPVIRRIRNGGQFIMSLGAGDTLQFLDGERKGLWIVQGVWASGQIVLLNALDAEGTSVFRPTAASMLKAGGVKVAVDPVGRIHPAHD